MDADDFEALFGAPPPPSFSADKSTTIPVTKSSETTTDEIDFLTSTLKKKKKKKKDSKKESKKKKNRKTKQTLDTNLDSGPSMGPLSPKFTSGKQLHTGGSENNNGNASKLFQAALLVTFKRDTTTSANIIPIISQCFPREKLKDLPSRIEYFCFPDVDEIVPLERQAATSFTFVLTSGNGERTYGFCRRYLPCGRAQQVRLDVGKRLPECLCLLSSYPYFSVFDYVLKTLQVRRWLSPKSMAPFLMELRNHSIPKCGGK
jgi:hypothetical protein